MNTRLVSSARRIIFAVSVIGGALILASLCTSGQQVAEKGGRIAVRVNPDGFSIEKELRRARAQMRLYIKDNMHNPNSFELVDSWHETSGDGPCVTLYMKCKGANALDAIVTNYYAAKVDLNSGNLVEPPRRVRR